MLMVRADANAFLIRQHLGHRSLDSTLAYVNPSDSEASAAASKARILVGEVGFRPKSLRRGLQADSRAREGLNPSSKGFGLSGMFHFEIRGDKRISQQ